ncbi:MAG: hypothetical protein JJU29_00185 [Verrucomicrobia bacterium]|nr:hypothetical protein [Verrucomicrobiota bacterium]MCH8511023.1 hypothetical protein [Kiritimatiellia bacterium]
MLLTTGCPTTRRGGGTLGPTPLQTSLQPYAPGERLNVGIEIFDPGNTNPAVLADQHSNAEIRKAETHFIPVHLKNTLDQSGYWGEVRVVPPEAKGMDVIVQGEILQSNGEQLAVRIQVHDSEGYNWFTRTYRDNAQQAAYQSATAGTTDPFQHLYNAIANDMAAVRRRMDGYQVKTLRRTTEMLFAADLVPEAFGQYVRKTPEGKTEVIRLPAENDPTWLRVEQISARNEMFFDALHATYEPFYMRMWNSYLEWRRFNLVEQTAIRRARSDGIRQATAGIIMIAAAILLEVRDVDHSSTMRDVLIIGGTQVIINGVNISQRTELHEATLQELAESFGSEANTVTVQLEGQTVSLTGSVDEQMKQWRELLRKLHHAETAMPGDPPAETLEPEVEDSTVETAVDEI